MSFLPIQLIESLEGVPGFDRVSFEKVHEVKAAPVSVRLNPFKKEQQLKNALPIREKVPWSSHGYYLTHRPSFTLDPLFHAGTYYVQEASSMFLEQALIQTTDLSKNLCVLDLCAAPGGKSTLIQSLLSSESLLISNEVIRQRVNILEENCTKWGASNIIVTSNEAKDFRGFENLFDVVVIDAPCSGSGLFRKDQDAVEEWSAANVQMCSRRQQQILSDIYPALKDNGILIYATCSFSELENEYVCDWLLETFQLEPIKLDTKEKWNIVESHTVRHATGYRFFPDKVEGEGFFLACFRKKEGDAGPSINRDKKALSSLSRKEEAIAGKFLKPGKEVQTFKWNDMILAMPPVHNQMLHVLKGLYIKKAGVALGKIVHDELIPEHALALSTILSDQFVAVSLNKEEALQYLRRQEVKIDTHHKGWSLVQYEGINLGWIKALTNRINNYYPKEWRILKSENH